MNLFFKRVILFVTVSLSMTVNLYSQDIPSLDSEWMLVTPKKKCFYLDGFNKTNVWTDAMIAYDSRGSEILRGVQPVLLVTNGVAEGMVRRSGKLPEDSLVIAAKWDSLKWLEENVTPGDKIKIIPATPFLPFSITFPIDKINSEIKKNGQLVVFTSKFGSKTPSNIYRQQAIISKGRVIAKTGGSANIPSDGFVLAGHGTGTSAAGGSRILRWVGIGCKVKLASDYKSFTVTTDCETWFLRAENYLKKAKQFASINNNLLSFQTKKRSHEYIKIASEILNAAKRAKQNNNNKVAWNFIKQSLSFSKNAMIAASLPVPANSMRTIAIAGPISARSIEIIREAGFNTILLYYLKSNPKLQKTAQLIREAGLKIFLWTILPSRFPLPPKLKKQLSKDYKKNGSPTNFVDLSVSENRQAVCKELARICELFDVDGVTFDYENYGGGYSKESIKRFCKKQNIPVTEFDVKNLSGEMAQKWEMWLRSNVKAMLFEASKTLHEMPRPRKAALCIFPSGGRNVKSLDQGTTAHPGPAVWLDWLKTSTFDMVQFMLYSQDVNWLKQRTNVLFPLLRANNKKLQIESWLIYWPEICGWTNPVPIDNLLQQSDAMIRAKSDGVAFFHNSNLNALNMPYFKTYFNAMRNGVYRLSPSNQTTTKIKTIKTVPALPTTCRSWKSKFTKRVDPVWKYYQFGASTTNPATVNSEEIQPMRYLGRYWQSTKHGKHGHPIVFCGESGTPALSYMALKNPNGCGYWSAIGFAAPKKGKYSISGEIKFKRYKNGASITNGCVEVIIFSSSGEKIKSFQLRSGKSSSISQKQNLWQQHFPVDGIEMNKNDLLIFRPFTQSFNAGPVFQATFDLAIREEQ